MTLHFTGGAAAATDTKVHPGARERAAQYKIVSPRLLVSRALSARPPKLRKPCLRASNPL